MPFPLDKVRTLEDFEGRFSLNVKCRTCAHERTIPARTLAEIAGRRALVRHVVHRLRCSKCRGRNHHIWVVDIPRQR